MRFKRYILLSLVLCGLVACSDDNTIEIPEAPVLEKAQLALAIKSEKGAMTKAGDSPVTDRYRTASGFRPFRSIFSPPRQKTAVQYTVPFYFSPLNRLLHSSESS